MFDTGAGGKLSVAIPASFVIDIPHLREKTSKLGMVARACSIFGVREIILYPDNAKHDQEDAMQLCSQILDFIETPQYLRKRLFRLTPSLKFAGVLPPLQTPPHDVPRLLHQCKKNDVREGVVIVRRGETLTVDVGLECSLECRGTLASGSRLTVRLMDVGENLTGEIIDPSKVGTYEGFEASTYWGYKIRKISSLGRLLGEHRYDITIGTSRYGSPLNELWNPLHTAVQVGSVMVAFGSPKRGLQEILQDEKINAENSFDYVVNTMPNQNTATVRTEEALLVTLGLLNAIRKLP